MKLLALALLCAGCIHDPYTETTTLSQLDGLRLKIDDGNGSGLPFYVGVRSDGGSIPCRVLGADFSVTLAGNAMTVDPGYLDRGSDADMCYGPEAYTFQVPMPLEGILEVSDRSLTISCDVSAPMGEGIEKYLDCGGISNSFWQ